MGLTLENFESQIERKILERGRDYYLSCRVVDLEEGDDGVWTARVEGTDDYEVSIQQDANGDLEGLCDCPYDWGPICKHIAAVLFAIRDASEAPPAAEARPKQPKQKRESRTASLRAALMRLPQEELVEILMEEARQDRQLANTLLMRYGGDEAAGKGLYVRAVRDALKAGRAEYGFIDYMGARVAGRGVEALLKQADVLLAHGKPLQAALIGQAILEEVTDALEAADDSDGELSGCIDLACELLKGIASQLEGSERRSLFEYFLSQAEHKRYKGWGMEWGIARIAANLIETGEERAELFALLDRLGQRGGSDFDLDGFRSRYSQERAEEIKLSVIERQDGEEAKLAFLAEHSHLDGFRQALITHHLERGAYAEAKRLCQEGVDACPPKMFGVRATYDNLLLEIARREKDTDAICRLGHDLFLDRGHFGYYDILKEAVAPDEWESFVAGLLRDLEQRPYWVLSDASAEIYAREGMWKKLLALAQRENQPRVVEHYRKPLEERFPAAMCDLYEKIATGMLEGSATGRDVYQAAARYLHRMVTLGKGERVREVIDRLIAQFPRRRAMVEELNRIRPR